MLYKYRIELRDENDNVVYKTSEDYEIGPNLMFKKLTDVQIATGASMIETELMPEEAFGERRRDLVRTYVISAFGDEAPNLYPGVYVVVEGLQGRVVSIGSGRVLVDHNHPLAGRKLKAKVEVIEIVRDPSKIIDEVLKYHKLNLKVSMENGMLKVEGEERAKKDLKNLLEYYGIGHDGIQL